MADTAQMLFLIGGNPVPASECDWALVRPCGCVVGACLVECQGRRIATDERAAWREFYPTARERKRVQQQGYTVRIGRRNETVRLLGVDCTHREGLANGGGGDRGE